MPKYQNYKNKVKGSGAYVLGHTKPGKKYSSINARGKEIVRVAINEWRVAWEHSETREVPASVIQERNALMTDVEGLSEAQADEAFTSQVFTEYLPMPQQFDGYNNQTNVYADTKKLTTKADIGLLQQSNATHIGPKQAFHINHGGDMEAFVWYKEGNKEYVTRLYDNSARFSQSQQYLTPNFARSTKDMYEQLTSQFGSTMRENPTEIHNSQTYFDPVNSPFPSAFPPNYNLNKKRKFTPTGGIH